MKKKQKNSGSLYVDGFVLAVPESRKHRDEVNAKVMKDSMMNEDKWKDKPMPFDMKRMAYGGFKTIVS